MVSINEALGSHSDAGKGEIRQCLPLSCCKPPERNRTEKISFMKEMGVKCFISHC